MAVSYTHLDVYKRQALNAPEKVLLYLIPSNGAEQAVTLLRHLEKFRPLMEEMCIRDRLKLVFILSGEFPGGVCTASHFPNTGSLSDVYEPRGR